MVSGVDPPLRLEGVEELVASIRVLEKSDPQHTSRFIGYPVEMPLTTQLISFN
jgi:hypothetical protein